MNLLDRVSTFCRSRWGEPQPARVDKFEQRAPDHRNAIELFAGRWATHFSSVNTAGLGGTFDFVHDDPRPSLAARYLGSSPGRLDGMSVLELGPLEAAHTCQLEQLGAERILAIEANSEAFLKCLIMKEVFQLKRTGFLLGDFSSYLAETSDRFDLIFCSGVLYHMEHPLRLILDIARVADRCFVWTHYYDGAHPKCSHRVRTAATLDGFSVPYFTAPYQDRAKPRFWGGNKASSAWMARGDLVAAFRQFGFERVEVLDEQPDHVNGPCFSLAVSKSPARASGSL
jgi:SAM-dependent methyltransferase